MNDDIAIALQQQVSELATKTQMQADQIIGLTAVVHVLFGVLLSGLPESKRLMAEALAQVLERPETMPNEYALGVLGSVLEEVSRPSRVTPEGRRAWLHLVATSTAQRDGPAGEPSEI